MIEAMGEGVDAELEGFEAGREFFDAVELYRHEPWARSRKRTANSHDRRPRAKPLRARSAALFERQIRPSSRKRAKDGQRRSM